ncbi:H-NS family nucleoid-associated regulatory protein [Pseudosulfitobacter pseudonitzschiae]|uniref:H-NS histone family protein n=1 Tax=Pseudosulfitobacter pseudonitzschiae TaxID=1402135 RepID=UPI003B821E5B
MTSPVIKAELEAITERFSDMDIDQIDMSIKELEKLIKVALKHRKSKEDAKRKEALAQVEAIADEMGFSLDDLLTRSPGKSRKKKTLTPKYRSPDDPSLTWVGRGRVPDWLKALEDSGRSREEFLIE